MKKSSFHYTNLKNNGVIVIPRFSTVYGSVRTSFGDLGEKFTYIEITNEIAELQEFNTNLEICLPHCAYSNNLCYVIVIYEGPFMYLVNS